MHPLFLPVSRVVGLGLAFTLGLVSCVPTPPSTSQPTASSSVSTTPQSDVSASPTGQPSLQATPLPSAALPPQGEVSPLPSVLPSAESSAATPGLSFAQASQISQGFPGDLLQIYGSDLAAVERVLFAGQSLTIQQHNAQGLTVLLPDGNVRGQMELFTAAGRFGGFSFALMGSSAGGGGGGGGGGASGGGGTAALTEASTQWSTDTLVLESDNVAALSAAFPQLQFTTSQGVTTVQGPAMTAEALAAQLQGQPHVGTLYPDSLMTLPAESSQGGFSIQQVPSDPLYASSIGSLSFRKPWQDMHFESAWDLTQGNNTVRIAVLSDGADVLHPELQHAVVFPYDVLLQQNTLTQPSPQGTRLAGLIAAEMDNATGTTGACPACEIMPINIANAQGQVSGSHLARGIYYAVEQGAQIIVIGAAGGHDNTVQHALQYAFSQDCVVFSGMGEDGLHRMSYPAGYGGVVAVGALNTALLPAAFSNTGSHQKLSAPGQYLLTTWPRESNTDTPLQPPLDVNHGLTSGTDASAALVAGAAGLIRALYPQLSALQVQQALVQSRGSQGLLNVEAALIQAAVLAQQTVNHAPTARLQVQGLPVAGQTLRLTVQTQDADQDNVSVSWQSSAGVLSQATGNETQLMLPASGQVRVTLQLQDGKLTTPVQLQYHIQVIHGDATLNLTGGLY